MMEFLKKIPSNIYLIFSLIFITIAIALLFFGEFIFAFISLVIGIISLTAWTFFGLFEETKNT
ncbi:hypothetical protein [Prochlorococcus marinus]|uniref:hypothetical protein n=1 Tax=Prochlorococcus marinus TaxID=1219 RepID=UPI0022B4BD5D|nr:hypothetical protein [Prochlorococcus marinus]